MFKLLIKIFGALLVLFVFPSARPGATAVDEPDPSAPSFASQTDGHEVSDASARVVGLYVLGLLAVVVVTMIALGWMYVRLFDNTPAMPVSQSQENFRNGPETRSSIAQDWAVLDAEAHEHLDRYRWIDREHGVVQVPIAHAMELVAAEGLPARPEVPPPFPAPAEEKLTLAQLQPTPHATNPDSH